MFTDWMGYKGFTTKIESSLHTTFLPSSISKLRNPFTPFHTHICEIPSPHFIPTSVKSLHPIS